MEVIMADCAGFCFGVKRAVDAVYELLRTEQHICTYGPIVHNESVVEDLKARGVRVLETKEDLEALDPAEHTTVVIRAHGVGEEIYDLLRRKNVTVRDLTCPFVAKIHRTVKEAAAEGKHIYIAGDPSHPEVMGILGWCDGNGTVAQSPEAAQILADSEDFGREPYCLVAQTTYQPKNFTQIVDIFAKKGYNGSVVNTICNATRERQEAAARLAEQVDYMIVIGGKNSSNSRKLYEICCSKCPHTVYIQTLDDLNLELPKSVRKVGITAGASTPQNIIEEVQKHVRADF
ncbi:MAG: 4-hydroxy-3-methylbut-2-enyl diphosphate reductase [Lachnospiraceae bacterium]|nr:4-hydroxy-3-methylbut-2-enyl diphosphate reductase [Lachnospiraceae bacterium]